ncbi:MAG: tetratricopeptide repeat protein [Methylococcales bacterium]|nr:tetratricopeptide repeat protein [Methylococcales bacterium]
MDIQENLQQAIQQHQNGQLQDAERLYRHVLKVTPNHAEANHNLAVLTVQNGQLNKALPFFQQALDSNPNQGQFWVNYIDTLICTGQQDKAQKLLNRGRSQGLIGESVDQLETQLNADTEQKKRPSQIQTDFIIALHAKGKTEEALDALNKLLTNCPDIPLLYNIQGACYANLEQPVKAINSYQYALKIKPDYADVHNNLGFTLQDLGQFDAAVQCYQQTITINPNFAEAHNNLGTAYNELGQFKTAVNCFENALTIRPNYAEAHSNLGNALQNLGRLARATISYKNAININPNFAEAHNNLGNVLQERGQLKAAVKSYRQALKIKPDFAQAHFNLGNTLKNLCQLDVTIESYEQALKFKPDYTDAHYNLGNTLKEVGKLDAAVESYTQTLQLNPEYADAHNNLGNVLNKLNQPIPALTSIQQALSIDPENPLFWETFVAILQGIKFTTFNTAIMPFLRQALEQPSVRPSDISSAIMSNLRHHPQLKAVLNTYKTSTPDHTEYLITRQLTTIPLLLQLMTLTPLPNPEVESLLTHIRRSMLDTLFTTNNTHHIAPFYEALAIHCFTNEYVFFESDDETIKINHLENKINLLLKKDKTLPSAWIILLASYRPLNHYAWSEQLLSPHYLVVLEKVIVRQLIEVQEEQRLRSKIHKITTITNKISKSVRDQYEQSPYPRWVNAGLYSTPLPIEKALENLDLKLNLNKQPFSKKPDILIAGCGTGQHALNTASRFLNSNVLAIDLSLSSLSYAIRKTQELSVSTIDYMQADILKLNQLNRQFDLIESVGVLHHLEDPLTGWAVLIDLLRPKGLMKIGLYSELARQAIVTSRDFIKTNHYSASTKDIRQCRTDIVAMAQDADSKLAKILTIPDFYNLSECRDLLFHIQEHRFTLPEIEAALQQLGLQFLGFELGHSQTLDKFKMIYSADDALFSLSNWHQFECQHPDTFSGMYQFWVQKI